MFKSNDSIQLACICVPAGVHGMPTAVVRWSNHDRTITIILCLVKSFPISRAMNVHINPFFIWNSCSFQTQFPKLPGLQNKQSCHILFNPTLHKFSFSVQVYFNLKQHGQNVNTFSPCLLLLLSGVGAQSAGPGPSRKCRPLVRTVMLYLWRHRAQSTML